MTNVDETVTSSLRSDQRTAPSFTLAGQHALPLVLLRTVGTKQVSNLTSSNPDISGGHISVGANVLAQLAHEGDAELPDLVVGFALGIEVCSSLATTDVHCRLISSCAGGDALDKQY